MAEYQEVLEKIKRGIVIGGLSLSLGFPVAGMGILAYYRVTAPQRIVDLSEPYCMKKAQELEAQVKESLNLSRMMEGDLNIEKYKASLQTYREFVAQPICRAEIEQYQRNVKKYEQIDHSTIPQALGIGALASLTGIGFLIASERGKKRKLKLVKE